MRKLLLDQGTSEAELAKIESEVKVMLWKVLSMQLTQNIHQRKVCTPIYMPERIIKYTRGNKGGHGPQMMEIDPKVFVMGLGVSYKNGADGTTAGLKAKISGQSF